MPFPEISPGEVRTQARAASTGAAPLDKVAQPLSARPHGLLSRLRSYCILDPLIWFYTVVLGIISLPVTLLPNRERALHGFSRTWSWLIMKTIFSPVKVTGLENLDPSEPHVFAVNHASALDIPVLYVYLPFLFRIAFK